MFRVEGPQLRVHLMCYWEWISAIIPYITLGILPKIMENGMEKQMEHEMETGVI